MSGKVALVTGAAGGVGAASARLFGAEGAELVAVTDTLDERGEQVAAEIRNAGGNAMFIRHDVTDESSWHDAVDGVLAQAGRLDVLVNNAGISGAVAGDGYDIDLWSRLMGVNCTGVFLGVKHGVRAMQNGRGGSIVNVSSIAGLVGHAGLHLGYNASKGAVRLLTKGAAARHGADGIRVNSVHPGLLPPMVTSGTTQNPEKRRQLLQGVPLRREGRVTEVANAILFLSSDESSYITGAELVVDGGYTAV
ncbi:glucose 1-dehydrogenase [Sphaerisporangium sp. NPDC051011]|uniref:SDR family NAD(P)-dependent oxidoreductase n=1 Tax=Sphaerisporangium sp. NPDC051011 TaxID=3155792 RepID=UPI0033DD7793